MKHITSKLLSLLLCLAMLMSMARQSSRDRSLLVMCFIASLL